MQFTYLLGDAYHKLTDHHKALENFEILLKIKEKRLKTRNNLEVSNVIFKVAEQTKNVGKYQESLNMYQEVLGK